jgi:UDP-N-acetyl-D-galactosamine dehydrogenase
MNELSSIFQMLDIDTQDVLAAASTKWNFLPFKPGLVGGHCIGVDPFYLTYRAERAGYRPEVILAGRRINDEAGKRVARETVRHLLRRGVPNPSVAVLGLTFKENVPDTRNSKSLDILRELESFGIDVKIHDPMALADDVQKGFGRTMTPLDKIRDVDAVILAVSHSDYVQKGWPLVTAALKGGKGIVFDVRACLDRAEQPDGVELLRM